jgi:predicted  nucleic acid-binding Zn-ribbon protein
MKKILIEVSAGELLDKISILHIKLDKIKDKNSLDFIKNEYDVLIQERDKNIDLNDEINNLYIELKTVNEKLWIIEDEKRLYEKNSKFDEKFIQVSRDIHFLNDRRAVIKLNINKILGSNIREIKLYTKY